MTIRKRVYYLSFIIYHLSLILNTSPFIFSPYRSTGQTMNFYGKQNHVSLFLHPQTTPNADYVFLETDPANLSLTQNDFLYSSALYWYQKQPVIPSCQKRNRHIHFVRDLMFQLFLNKVHSMKPAFRKMRHILHPMSIRKKREASRQV